MTREEALESYPAQLIRAGRPIYITTVKVAASGMSRTVRVWTTEEKTGRPIYLHSLCCTLGITDRVSNPDTVVRVHGCGMDMHFHIAYSLGGIILGDGYAVKYFSI